MAVTLPSVYQDGTATVAANGTVVTGQSTLWTKAIIPGDFFGVHKGYSVRILSVDSDTQVTLANPWPGAAQTAAHYEIMLCPDTSRMQETSRQLLQQLSNGNVAAFAGLTGEANKVPYFTGPGALSLMDVTTAGQALVGAASAAAQRTALGLGTAAVANTGTSGATVPLLNGANTWSGIQILPEARISGDAGTYRPIKFQTSGSDRWWIAATNGAESGSNASSNLAINSYDDTGTYLATPLSISRASNIVNIDKGLSFSTAAAAATTRNNLGINTTVATRAALKALDTTIDKVAYLSEAGRAGAWVWLAGDYSAPISADTQEGLFLKANAIAATAGAWVRVITDHINVKWFGAIGNNSADDTTPVSCAITVALLATTPNRLYFPLGQYKITGALPDITSGTIIYGDGPRDTYLMLTGSATMLFVRGTSSARSTNVSIRDMNINAVSMTNGFALYVDFTQGFLLENVIISDPYNGIYVRQSGELTFRSMFVGNVRGVLGFHAQGSNTTRNSQNDQIDVLTFEACVIQGNYVVGGAVPTCELMVIDGRVHTIQTNGLRLLSGLRGLRTRNTFGLAAEYRPRFLTGVGLEAESHYAEPILLEYGDDLWIKNVFAVGSATADGMNISSNVGTLRIDTGSINANQLAGINNQGCANLILDSVDIYNNSLVGANQKSGLYVAGSGRTAIFGGVIGKATWLSAYTELQKYGVELDSAFAGGVTGSGVILVGNSTGPLYDNGNSIVGSRFADCAGLNTKAVAATTVGASGYTYTAGLVDEAISIYDGAGVVCTISGVIVSKSTPANFVLPARKAVVISYTSAPSVISTKM